MWPFSSEPSSDQDIFSKFAHSGHFYSPLPDLEYIRQEEKQIFNRQHKVNGIDFNLNTQIDLLNKISQYFIKLLFSPTKNEYRYYYENDAFSYGDAITLFGMINHFKPNKIIEIGSGYSSALILDTNEKFFDNKIDCTFVEPFPEVLKKVLRKEDRQHVRIIEDKIQNVDLSIFSQLKANDILFIDSSHVSKIGSDLNRIIFEILPVLKQGVAIHFHDIFYPFEYPSEWVYAGRAWNEIYILRAFLMYNSAFKIILHPNQLAIENPEKIYSIESLYMKNIGGSIWIKKVI